MYNFEAELRLPCLYPSNILPDNPRRILTKKVRMITWCWLFSYFPALLSSTIMLMSESVPTAKLSSILKSSFIFFHGMELTTQVWKLGISLGDIIGYYLYSCNRENTAWRNSFWPITYKRKYLTWDYCEISEIKIDFYPHRDRWELKATLVQL